MVRKDLLEKELEWYKNRNIEIKPVKYNKDIFQKLFEKYDYYGMCEYSFCCYGVEHSCWVEVVEEGNWNLTLDKVKRNILNNIKECKKYLYNGKKYGGNRLHIGEKDGVCYVFIYLRDKLGVDYSIWFEKNNKK